MEIVLSIWGITATICIFRLFWYIAKLISTVNKQQKQIDCLDKEQNEMWQRIIDSKDKINNLSELTVHMNQCSMDIATKVMSIEERVDKHDRLIDYCADGIVNLEKRINIIDKIV